MYMFIFINFRQETHTDLNFREDLVREEMWVSSAVAATPGGVVPGGAAPGAVASLIGEEPVEES
jgi:hypothetical protein